MTPDTPQDTPRKIVDDVARAGHRQFDFSSAQEEIDAAPSRIESLISAAREAGRIEGAKGKAELIEACTQAGFACNNPQSKLCVMLNAAIEGARESR